MSWAIQGKTPWVIAHRGASAYAPENTLAAFRKAYHLGADAVELDVHLTADQVPVVIHDADLKRTTGKAGKVNRMLLKEVKKLDAGSHFGVEFAGEAIPTLDEVIEEIGQKVLFDIELKDLFNPFSKLPEVVARVVQRHHVEDRILFSSFNPIFLTRVKALLPDVMVGLLILPGWYAAWSKSGFLDYQTWDMLIPHYKDILLERVLAQHKIGRKLSAYTVNSKEEVISLLDVGIDGIITNDPILVTGLRRTDDSTRMARAGERAVSG